MIFPWTGLWDLAIHFGTGGMIMAGIAAVAYFFPPLRRDCVWAGILVIALMAIYSLGVHDEAKHWKAKEAAALAAGESARADAVNRVEHPSPKRFWMRNDADCRDCKK